MNKILTRLGNGWLWGGSALCFFLGLLFNSLAGHGFLALVFFCLAALLSVFKALELLKKHKWARITTWCLTVMVGIGLLLVIPTGIIVASHCDGDLEVQCEYVVVLGAGVHGTTPSLSLQSRLEAAAEYLQQRPDVICILSGGQGPGEDITEARCMYDWLIARGIPAQQLWMEDRSTSTEENLRFTLDLIETNTGLRPERINLLSNEYHLYRGKIFAKKVGVEAYGVPAKTPYPTLFLNYYLREIAGVWHEILIGG